MGACRGAGCEISDASSGRPAAIEDGKRMALHSPLVGFGFCEKSGTIGLWPPTVSCPLPPVAIELVICAGHPRPGHVGKVGMT